MVPAAGARHVILTPPSPVPGSGRPTWVGMVGRCVGVAVGLAVAPGLVGAVVGVRVGALEGRLRGGASRTLRRCETRAFAGGEGRHPGRELWGMVSVVLEEWGAGGGGVAWALPRSGRVWGAWWGRAWGPVWVLRKARGRGRGS
jgi:hypothetical protein